MSVIDKIKKIFFEEDTISQEIVVQNMQKEIDKLKEEYEGLISLQEELKLNPKAISAMQFAKKEKYIEMMDHVKFKNVNLIKEHEFTAMKYNILIELYVKLKNYISNINGEFLLDFNFDKYKQPIAVISMYGVNPYKIVLLKNTFHNEDYLLYNIGEDVEILDICSQEPNVNHGRFMMEALYKTIDLLRTNGEIKAKKIILAKDATSKKGFSNAHGFFKKQGFEEQDGAFFKAI